MLRLAFPLILVLAVAAPTGADDQEVHYDLFQLWNECRPMHLYVHILPSGASAIGLTEENTKIAVRRRLRLSDLHSEDYSETAGASLFVNIRVFGPSFGAALEYWKVVRDRATGLENRATTWYFGTVGAHEQNWRGVVAATAKDVDKFISEYLRVNDSACRKSK